MSWTEEIKKSRIARDYHNATLETANLLPEKLVEYGKAWLKAPARPSLFLYGNPGSGKTHFSICLLRYLIEHGIRSIVYVRSDDLENELLDASLGQLYNSMGYKVSERELLARYSESDYLFIDDIGTERDTDRVKKQYTRMLDARVGNGLVSVFSSNLDMDGMRLALGDRFESRLKTFKPIAFPNQDIRAKKPLPDILF